MVERARELQRRDDGVVAVQLLLHRIDGRFADFLDTAPTPEQLAAIRAAETIGRPLGAS